MGFDDPLLKSSLELSLLVVAVFYVLVRLRGPALGLLLADVLVLNVLGYAAGSKILCATEQTVCAPDVVILANVVALSTLVSAILATLILTRRVVTRRGKLPILIKRWTDLPLGVVRTRSELRLHIGLLFFCAMISLLFVYKVLSPTGLGVSLYSLVKGDTSLLDIRKAVTAGTQGYFAPGYLKQVRDILFPVVCGAFVLYRIPKEFRFWFFLAVITVLLAMLISGQRTPFMILFAVVLVCLYIRHSRKTFSRKFLFIWLMAIAFAFYFIVTVFLGHSVENLSITSNVPYVLLGILKRVFVQVPYENMITQSLWWNTAPTFGLSWLQDLSSILPGKISLLYSELHQAAGGSAEGNSPLGLAADLFLAFGWVGAIVIPVLYVWSSFLLDQFLLSSRSAFAVPLKVFVTFASLQWYSPFLFVLNGGALLLFWVAVRLIWEVVPKIGQSCKVENRLTMEETP